MASKETKRDRFLRVAELRTQNVLDSLRSLAKCSAHASYEYTDKDIEKILLSIEAELQSVRDSFAGRKRFSLSTHESAPATESEKLSLDAQINAAASRVNAQLDLQQSPEIQSALDAVLVELDYKGSYERYALTPAEFSAEFGSRLAENMPAPSDEAATYTLRPLVHVWYQATSVGSEFWNRFFTDLSDGLPYSDIESGNLAVIRPDRMSALTPYLPAQQAEHKTALDRPADPEPIR